MIMGRVHCTRLEYDTQFARSPGPRQSLSSIKTSSIYFFILFLDLPLRESFRGSKSCQAPFDSHRNSHSSTSEFHGINIKLRSFFVSENGLDRNRGARLVRRPSYASCMVN